MRRLRLLSSESLRLGLGAFALTLFSLVAAAQDVAPVPAASVTPSTTTQQDGGQEPQSHAATIYVTHREAVLDVVVTDHSGKPIANLDKAKFRIFEDGIEQTILGFTPPEDHVPPPDAPPVTSAEDLKKLGNIPINIIILDELDSSFEATSYGRYEFQQYLKTQPAILKQPTTVVSISDSNLKVLHDYTQNRDELIDMAKHHIPVYPFRAMKGGDGSDQLGRCFSALMELAQSVKGYPGRKNIIWIGKGFPSLDTDKMNADKALEAGAALQLLTKSLLESRITLNIVDPSPMAISKINYADPDFVSPNQLLEAEGVNGTELFPGNISFANFAPATGGLSFYARNDVDKQIATAINDGSVYYTLTYSPTNESNDATQFRQIRIKLEDPALVAWTRTGYYMQHEVKPGEMPPAPTTHDLAFDLTSAALAAMPYSGLYVSADKADDGYKVTVAPVGVTYRLSKAGHTIVEMTVMSVGFGGKKEKVIDHQAEEVTQVISAPSEPFSFTVKPPDMPGANRLRIVVRDAVSGHIGTVDLAVEQPAAAEPSPAKQQRKGRRQLQ